MSTCTVPILFVLVVAALAACDGERPGAVARAACGAQPPHRALDVADHGRRLDLAPGDRFTVALESTPSAGFAWSVEQLDPALVRAAGRTVTVVEQAFGSPALETWCFIALAVGDTPLVLRYHRAAQPAIPPARYFTLSVRVR